ncbi:MAG: hypothetical protein H0X42_11770, partial [Solirubrobacterales bacterium]|nr:hypothetical protein [Solirubrobacterales bacterium]
PARVAAALRASAVAIGTSGQCAVGAGLIEAEGAVETLLLPESEVTPLACAAPLSPPEPEPSPTPTPLTPIVTPTPTPTPAAAPTTSFKWHPPRLVRTRGRTARVAFRFASDQSPATFLCAVDRGGYRVCGAGLARSFAIGAHMVRVEARNAAGLLDATAAVFSFRVKPVG